MDPGRWRRVEDVFHSALERAPDERAAFLTAACDGDEDLRREVQSLLDQTNSAEHFLESPASTPAVSGQIISHYRILEHLGAGGMGVVYKAEDLRLKRPVALKFLPGELPTSADARQRLLREARAAAALNHPHICTIHEVGEHDGLAFIAMELIDGEPLHRVVPPGSGLPLDQVLRFGSQVAEALAHAHARGVLHRDLKTQNIVITGDGRVKVLDFGLAKRFATDTDTTAKTLSIVTAAGTIAGTPAYMAPEQWRGQGADARSDVWALGVVLYEMTTGERPFDGDTGYELSSAILTAPPRPLPTRVPRELRAFIWRCLEKSPMDRFQTAEEARAALDAVRLGIAPLAIPRLRLTRNTIVATSAAVLLFTALMATGLNIGGLRERLWNSAPLFDSIAVLPLENASSDPDQAYLAAGLQQGLTSELAELPGFTKVIGTASTRRFRQSKATLGEIARHSACERSSPGRSRRPETGSRSRRN